LYFSMTRILVNHVYYSPVGHVVEAIRYARGFHNANPGSEVHVALSDGAPWELCAGAQWIAGVYRIPVADPGSCKLSVPEMPREWDYIVDNNLMALEDESPDLLVRPGRVRVATQGLGRGGDDRLLRQDRRGAHHSPGPGRAVPGDGTPPRARL
jgi:hypothetical protein